MAALPPPDCTRCQRAGRHTAAATHTRETCPFQPAAAAATPEAWKPVVAATAEKTPTKAAKDAKVTVEIVRSEIDKNYQRVRHEAEAEFGSGLGLAGTLKWVDSRCAKVPGWHHLDPWWIYAFTDPSLGFYASKKTVMTCRKGLRAGGSSSATRALGNDALFTLRELDPGTIGVIPIISSSRDEATGRFVTLRQQFRACGLSPAKGDEEEGAQIIPGGLGGEYKSSRAQSGGGLIKVLDSQGHSLEFAVLPALKRSGVGYTAVDGFIDESDLWPNDPETHVNPAGDVIGFVLERLTTQIAAHLYVFSASYNAESAHKALVDEGDTAIQHLARLGLEGARIDERERRRLAEAIGSTDPRLLAPGDPMSPDIPAWVTNPKLADIERCYAFAKQDLRRMLARYGGRAAENRGAQFPDSLADVDFPREATDWP